MSRRTGTPSGLRPASSWLAEAHPMDRFFVVALRRWIDGPAGQAEVWNGLATSLGPAPARHLLKAFERLLAQVAAAAVRPLLRHGTACPCLGEDEALLAGMVRSAGAGDADSARALAAAIVRESELLAVIEAAARLGRLIEEAGMGPVSAAEPRAPMH